MSSFLGFAGAIGPQVIGLGRFLTRMLMVHGRLDGKIQPIVVVYGIVLAMVVVWVGGLVPAIITFA